MSLFCEICRINVHSDEIMKQHCLGKKHKRNQVLYDKRKALADRSVFTRGFPPKTDEKTLREYFSQFGEIERILQDKDRGVYAIIEFTNGMALSKLFSQKTHLISGHRIVIKPREFKPPAVKPPDGKGHVKQRRERVDQSPACKAREHEQMLREFHYRVDCFPEPESLHRVVLSCTTVKEQMEALRAELELESDDLKAREKIVSTLHKLFLEFFAGCQLHVFGSSANGFGTKGCDMDLFLDMRTTERQAEEEQSETIQYPNQVINITFCDCAKCRESVGPKHKQLRFGGIKSLEGKEFPVSAKSLSEVTLFDKVKLLGRILQQFHSGCSDAHTIPSIRCPVVRFSHAPTGIKCDLSVNNRLALQNTRLLKYFCELDPRVRPLVFTLRYWGKLKEVSTNPVSGPRLTNYALSLMVVFFLQNTQPPVLPLVAELACSTDGSNKLVIDGWDCSFSEGKFENAEKNTASSEELLSEFFQFYCNIDFSNVVLCTRSGCIIPVSKFYCSLLQKDRAHHFKTGPISLQDPFVLDHNVTLNVNDKVRLKLVDELNNARRICQEFGSDKRTEQELWGLPLLFTPSMSDRSSSMVLPVDSDCKAFSIDLRMSQMSEAMVKYLNKSPDYRVEWVIVLCQFLRTVLTDVLLFNCDVLCDRRQELHATVCSQAINSVNLGTESAGNATASQAKEIPNINQTAEGCYESFKPVTTNTVSHSDQTAMEVSTSEDTLFIEPSTSSSHTAKSTTAVRNELRADLAEVKTSDVIPETDDSTTDICTGRDRDLLTSQCQSAGYTAPRSDTIKRCRREEDRGQDSVKRYKNDTNLNTFQESVTEKGYFSPTEKSTLPTSSSDFPDIPKSVSSATPVHTGHYSCTSGTTHLSCLHLQCTSVYRVWNGRKAAKRNVASEGVGDSLDFEKKVTEKLKSTETPSKKPLLQFTCEIKALIEPGKTAALVSFKPGKFGVKEFTCFYPFAKTYLAKAVDKYLEEIVPHLDTNS